MAPSAKMPSYRRSIRSRKREQSLNPGEKSQRLTRSMTKLPEMPHSRSRGSRSGVRSSIGRKRPRERRSVSSGNRQLQKPKELLRKPVGNTKPRSKRSKTPAPRLTNDTRLKTLVGKSRKRNWRRDCAGRTISSLSRHPQDTSLNLRCRSPRPSLRRVRLPSMSWSAWLPTIMPIWRRLPFAMKNSRPFRVAAPKR